MLKKWEDLPDFMRIPEVRPYWEILKRKQFQLFLKRAFDFLAALFFLFILTFPILIISIVIKIDSKGPVIYRQERVTAYGRHFRIHKFRTMVCDADKIGSVVTVRNDSRITRVGAILRHLRLDELPQLIDVLQGTMSFVGTRPEVAKYVEQYQPAFFATLLMPAGITSEASIRYKDEERLLNDTDDIDAVYLGQILPIKMKWNLESIRRFRLLRETLTMIRTVLAILGKQYS